MEQGKVSSNLQKVLEAQEMLKKAKAQKISFSKPLLLQSGRPAIFPNTVNVIQGQAGVHKSRLAETMCSTILKHPDCKNELLGFEREPLSTIKKLTVVYVDTERNLKEQLPYALQSIQTKAGYEIDKEPANFKYISLLPIRRHERFNVLKEYIDYLRKTNDDHLFIVLDVCTDCITDFNNSDKSMELIDLLNLAINENDVTFLCLIHENPNSDKARGHLGTEIMNKATTMIQVAYEKEAENKDSKLIRIKYLKCRNSERHSPFYTKYSVEAKGLVLANGLEVSDVINSRRQKAALEDVGDKISEYLGNGIGVKKQDLFKKLILDFDAKEKTIGERVKELIVVNHTFFDDSGSVCALKKTQKGKEVYYLLEKVLV